MLWKWSERPQVVVNTLFYRGNVAMMRLLQALTMSNEARKTTTVGEIVNLMSVDAQRLQDATGYLWMVWSAPLQICIAVAMLWNLLGASVLAGLTVMVLIIPINGVIATISRKLQVSSTVVVDHLPSSFINTVTAISSGAAFMLTNKILVINGPPTHSVGARLVTNGRWRLSSSVGVCNTAHMQRNSPGVSTLRASSVTSRKGDTLFYLRF